MSADGGSRLRQVDQNELRLNSTAAIVVLATAFVTDRWQLVAFQAGAMLLTALRWSLGPYVVVYRAVLRPAGIVAPDLRSDNPEPHRFAVTVGATVASTATYLLLTGRSVAGWVVVWSLAALATGSASGWCAGCFVYYTMNRLGLRALFKHAPIAGTFPGSRPPRS